MTVNGRVGANVTVPRSQNSRDERGSQYLARGYRAITGSGVSATNFSAHCCKHFDSARHLQCFAAATGRALIAWPYARCFRRVSGHGNAFIFRTSCCVHESSAIAELQGLLLRRGVPVIWDRISGVSVFSNSMIAGQANVPEVNVHRPTCRSTAGASASKAELLVAGG